MLSTAIKEKDINVMFSREEIEKIGRDKNYLVVWLRRIKVKVILKFMRVTEIK